MGGVKGFSGSVKSRIRAQYNQTRQLVYSCKLLEMVSWSERASECLVRHRLCRRWAMNYSYPGSNLCISWVLLSIPHCALGCQSTGVGATRARGVCGGTLPSCKAKNFPSTTHTRAQLRSGRGGPSPPWWYAQKYAQADSPASLYTTPAKTD